MSAKTTRISNLSSLSLQLQLMLILRYVQLVRHVFLFTNSNDFFWGEKSIKTKISGSHEWWVPRAWREWEFLGFGNWLREIVAEDVVQRSSRWISTSRWQICCALRIFPWFHKDFINIAQWLAGFLPTTVSLPWNFLSHQHSGIGFFHRVSLKAWGKTMDGRVVVFPWGRSSYHRQVRMNQKWWIFVVTP